MMKQLFRAIAVAAILVVGAFPFAGCHSIDDDRTPPAGVWIPFVSQSDWILYGTPGALDTREFIKSEGIPENFFYTAIMNTGYGGVLLVGDLQGNPAAYDLSCPVENRPDIRIKVDHEALDAYCPVCGSRYSIFNNYGYPLSGPAAKHGYALRTYNITGGPNGEYRVIRP